ncbi:MAG TPA: tRNA lysidine(34) synthetase TilS [Terriglobales bacterium]|nr:tRNA lysidine(34) synthetase TilS [Terriglobales bacterium]
MHSLAQRVGRYIREQQLLCAGERVGVAVSGGADSVALFRVLLQLREELGIVLSVVHVNHQIRGADADADQKFVADLAGRHGLPLHALSVDTPAYVAERRLSLEAAARELRYQCFRRLLSQNLDKVATAHSLDDQAETVVLRLARGTGTSGLAGIYPRWPLLNGPSPDRAIVRPLLFVRRSELQSWLHDLAQPWREDASNLDPRYARNRVRHRVLPLLETELNPRVCDVLAETAEIARAEECYWDGEVARVLGQVWTGPTQPGPGLHLAPLLQFPLALRRRLVRAAADSLGLSLGFQHVEEVLALAQSSPGGEKQAALPEGWRALRTREMLEFQAPTPNNSSEVHDFSYTLTVPGEVAVAETATLFRAILRPLSSQPAGQAYDPDCFSQPLHIRNWRPGDRFWPQHTRAPRKIKELLQAHKVPASQRRAWPVITCSISGQDQVIWLRGFPPPQQLLARPGQQSGLLLEEYALHGPEDSDKMGGP